MVISYITVSKVSVTFSPFSPENDTQGIKGQMCLFPVESCQKTKPQFGEISRQDWCFTAGEMEKVFWFKIKQTNQKVEGGSIVEEMSAMQSDPSGQKQVAEKSKGT